MMTGIRARRTLVALVVLAVWGQIGPAADFDGGGAQLLQDVQVDPGVPPDLLAPSQQQRADRHPAAQQSPRDHKAVPTVVPPSAQHQHTGPGRLRERLQQLADGLRARVLHEEERRDAALRGGPRIQIPHLRRRGNSDHTSSGRRPSGFGPPPAPRAVGDRALTDRRSS